MIAPLAVLVGLLLSTSGCDTGGDTAASNAPPDTLTLQNVPERNNDAITGSDFLSLTEDASYAERQTRAVCEIIAGNIPDELRTLAPVGFENERGDSLIIWVTRDYLSIGSADDDVRMPLSMPSARQVARAYEMFLPTTRIVDAVYKQADLRLDPQPMTPGPEMRSNDYYRRHQAMIKEQRAGRAPTGLIAGHKKDVVISTRLYSETDRVAIYGWHTSVGNPIQPLYLGHADFYEDYSHGLRLIWPMAHLEGEQVPLQDVFGDPAWRPILSNEQSVLLESLSWPESGSTHDCD